MPLFPGLFNQGVEQKISAVFPLQDLTCRICVFAVMRIFRDDFLYRCQYVFWLGAIDNYPGVEPLYHARDPGSARGDDRAPRSKCIQCHSADPVGKQVSVVQLDADRAGK